MKVSKIYLPYRETDNVNYIMLLRLYSIAEYDAKKKTFSIIQYTSFAALAETINKSYGMQCVSASSLRRLLLNTTEYSFYLQWIKEDKTIVLNNNFRKGSGNKKFISLTKEEIDFFLEQNDNFLLKYYLYQKYYCGFSREKKHDSTAKQMLETMGFSSASGKNISKISYCNRLLEERGFLCIERYTEKSGKYRNIYCLSATGKTL